MLRYGHGLIGDFRVHDDGILGFINSEHVIVLQVDDSGAFSLSQTVLGLRQ